MPDMFYRMGTDYHISSDEDTDRKKTLLIFQLTVAIGANSEAKARERLQEITEIYSEKFKKIQARTDYIIELFVLPTRGNDESKLECIFSGEPGNVYPSTPPAPPTKFKGFSLDGDLEENPDEEAEPDGEWGGVDDEHSNPTEFISRITGEIIDMAKLTDRDGKPYINKTGKTQAEIYDEAYRNEWRTRVYLNE